MNAKHPIVSPPGTWACLLELVCRDAHECELTETSARYLHVHMADAARLSVHGEPIWECTNRGRRWVWALEAERIIVVEHAEDHDTGWEDQHVQTFWWEVGFYLTEGAYEDRLDQLADVRGGRVRDCAIDRLLNVCETYGLDWWLASNNDSLTPGFRFEARIHEVSGPPVRIIERGATPYEAAAKAHGALLKAKP